MSNHGHESHSSASDSTGTLGHAVKGGLALAATDYLTGGMVQNLATQVATNVQSAINGGLASASPVLSGPLAPLVIAGGSIYDGVKNGWAERGLWGAIEKTALNYGLIAGGLTAAGIIAAPYVIPVAATGIGMYGLRHAYSATKSIVSNPVEYFKTVASAPFRWTGQAWNFLKGGSRNAPAAAH